MNILSMSSRVRPVFGARQSGRPCEGTREQFICGQEAQGRRRRVLEPKLRRGLARRTGDVFFLGGASADHFAFGVRSIPPTCPVGMGCSGTDRAEPIDTPGAAA
jgi:hypothetical protein